MGHTAGQDNEGNLAPTGVRTSNCPACSKLLITHMDYLTLSYLSLYSVWKDDWWSKETIRLWKERAVAKFQTPCWYVPGGIRTMKTLIKGS